MVLLSVGYSAYSSVVLITKWKSLKSSVDTILHIMVEVALTIFLFTIMVYHFDHGENLSATAKSNYELTSIWTMVIAATL